jgi:hypothetical protein
LLAVTTKSVNQEVLEEIIRRVVETAQPERIILFGSAARGMTATSSAPVSQRTSSLDKWNKIG